MNADAVDAQQCLPDVGDGPLGVVARGFVVTSEVRARIECLHVLRPRRQIDPTIYARLQVAGGDNELRYSARLQDALEDLGAFRWKNGRCAVGPVVIITRVSKVPGIPVDSHPTCGAGVIL